uniref:Pyrin domain-containing protein n=1 Tax=Paramormyrops kingsleyae TaxID=1676925 RepID=A0A3B3SHG6_9TELE
MCVSDHKQVCESHGLISDILQIQTSLPNLLLDYLEELSDEELKRFKWKLSNTKFKGYSKLPPYSRVKDLDITDFTELMIRSYGEVGALKVMLEVLKNMKLNGLVQRLKEDLQNGNHILNPF